MEQPQPQRRSSFEKNLMETVFPPIGRPATFAGGGAPQPPTTDNQIKVTMDGDRLQIVANVDAKGAQKLLKAIQANLALLGDDDEEAAN